MHTTRTRLSSPRLLRLSFHLLRYFLPPAAALVAALALVAPAHAISWSVDQSVLLAVQSGMALDASGNIHLALLSSGTILYKERVGGVYGSTETVDGGSGNSGPLIAVDGSGTPSVVYVASSTLYFRKRFGANNWTGFEGTKDQIDPTNGTPALAIDPSGNPHVLYYVGSPTSVLRHAWHDSGGWHREDVWAEANGIPVAMTFGASGTLYAAFSDLVYGELRYKIKNSSGWQTSELVFSNYGGGLVPSIALASGEQPSISCTMYNAAHTATSLAYVSRGASGWGAPIIIDNTSNVGASSCLALESGLARITYWDKTSWQVRSAWQCADGSWDLATVDANLTNPGGSLEPGIAWLALRSNGAPVVYYSDYYLSHVKDAANGAATSISTLGAGFGRTTSTTTFTLPTDCSGIQTLLPWEVRVASSPITTDAAWNAAAGFASGSDPQGTSHCFLQTSLPSCTFYYFAAKYTNRYGVLSGLSNSAGGKTRCSGSIEVDCGSGLVYQPGTDAPSSPMVLEFSQARPNPARDEASFDLAIPGGHEGEDVRFAIYDLLGRRVREVVHEPARVGRQTLQWQLDDESGVKVARGMYFARLQIGTQTFTHTVIVER